MNAATPLIKGVSSGVFSFDFEFLQNQCRWASFLP
jgi:hypothetical protein